MPEDASLGTGAYIGLDANPPVPPVPSSLRGNALWEVTWRREPWLMALAGGANEYLEKEFLPRLKRAIGVQPRFHAFSMNVPSIFLGTVRSFLTPILAVGYARRARRLMRLEECSSSTFNYIPKSPVVFDVGLFDAAFMGTEVNSQGCIDLAPLVVEFDSLLAKEGQRGSGICPTLAGEPSDQWNAIEKMRRKFTEFSL